MLTQPKLYMDLWGWSDPQLDDPSNELPTWEDFLENIGGSRWLATVTQYFGGKGYFAGNPTDLWGGAWNDPNPLPWGKNGQPCVQDSDCASTSCDPLSGYCFPTSAQLQAEVALAVAHFNPVDDGMIVVAISALAPHPADEMYHYDMPRSGHPNIAYIQAPYYGPDFTYGLLHEVAESITDPRPSQYISYEDSCDCEIGDRCHWAPDWQNITTGGPLRVGESPGTSTLSGNYDVQPLWSNEPGEYTDEYSGGGCVYYTDNHQDNYDVGCAAGHLRHWSGDMYVSGTDDFGVPTRAPLATSGNLAGVGATATGDGNLNAFAVDTGSPPHLHHMYDTNGTPAWSDYGAPSGYNIISSPDAFSTRPKTLQVVVAAQRIITPFDTELYYRTSVNGSLSGWQSWYVPPGVTISSRPATASWGYNRADVFVLSSDYPPHVWWGWSNDGGQTIAGWQDLGAGNDGTTWFSKYIDAAAPSDQVVAVFVLGLDDYVYEYKIDHGLPSGWMPLWNSPGGESPGLTLYDGIGATGLGDDFIAVSGVSNSSPNEWYENFADSGDYGYAPQDEWYGPSASLDHNICSGIDLDGW